MVKTKNEPKEYPITKPDEIDLVCFSHLRWDFVFQRPQHLLTRAAQERRVFYIEESILDDGPTRMMIRQDESEVWVITPHISNKISPEERQAHEIELVEQLFSSHQINQYILWFYTPMALPVSYQLKPAAVIYDCMDELSAFRGAPPKMLQYETELLQKADLVFTGGQSLYEAKKDRHNNVHAFPSSIDVAHFSQARSQKPGDEPIDQIAIPHPRLGFFGVIDERMDQELIAGMAAAHPEWHIVLIGPVVKVDPHSLPQAANIHYLGPKGYKELPRYLAGWDVAIMPFALTESTRFISPTKTPEYLAGGKPVVSTPIKDVVNPYGEKNMVRIGEGVQGFVQAVEETLADKRDRVTWQKTVDDFLSQNSWDYTFSPYDAIDRINSICQ